MYAHRYIVGLLLSYPEKVCQKKKKKQRKETELDRDWLRASKDELLPISAY